MALYTNMTSDAELDDAVKNIYDDEFIIAAEDTLSKDLTSIATIQRKIDGATDVFTIYTALTVQTSALTEDDDDREAASDSSVTITPAEYGNAVTQTNLADLKSGGRNSLALVRLASKNMRESMDKIMITVGEAGSNETIVGQSAETSVTSSDIITADEVRKQKAIMETAGVSPPYYCVIHPHVFYDLKKETGDEAFVKALHYADPQAILKGEYGMFDSFRFIIHPQVAINTNAGDTNVDTYHTQFFGFNAFGYSESQTPGGNITGPFDVHGRFLNIGWYGVFSYGLVDTSAHRLLTSASSMGTN